MSLRRAAHSGTLGALRGDMQSIEAGVHLGALPQLKSLLVEWAEVQSEYARAWNWTDVPWWYTERASIGTLAAAAWRLHWVALEEFSNAKRASGGTRHATKNSVGRCDLLVCDRLHDQDYLIEAKEYWPRLRSGPPGNRFSAILSKARTEAARVIPHEGAKRLAAVFVTPSIPGSYGHEIEGHLRRYVEWFSGLDRSAVAWTFPRRARGLTTAKGRTYPGVILVLRPLRMTRHGARGYTRRPLAE